MILDKILKHAKEELPKEACGLIVIFKGKEKYIECKNLAETSEDNFYIDPADYAQCEDMGEIIKIVHSHPVTNPNPSQSDMVGIEKSGIPWIIINPVTGQSTETSPSGYKAPLIGRVFVHGILDCYTMIRDYYNFELDIKLPDFHRDNYWWEKGQNLYEENFGKAGFTQVDDLKKNDVIIMTNGSSTPNHSAIYMGDGKILHHVQGRLSSKDAYGGYWLKNTWKVIRHEQFL